VRRNHAIVALPTFRLLSKFNGPVQLHLRPAAVASSWLRRACVASLQRLTGERVRPYTYRRLQKLCFPVSANPDETGPQLQFRALPAPVDFSAPSSTPNVPVPAFPPIATAPSLHRRARKVDVHSRRIECLALHPSFVRRMDFAEPSASVFALPSQAKFRKPLRSTPSLPFICIVGSTGHISFRFNADNPALALNAALMLGIHQARTLRVFRTQFRSHSNSTGAAKSFSRESFRPDSIVTFPAFS